MAKWMPETRPEGAPRTKLLASYKTLFGTGAFNCYLLMLIGGLAGIAVFEACSGVLMGRGARPEQHGGEYSVYSADSRRRSSGRGLPAGRTSVSRR
ncbi:multidrug resistance protein D [Klebsiella pneumoniae]|uniref:Multidrug resistance protein D n=1 Tax=Klebsiella pneumoniae TaxID=573 RepID=A0A378B641_KLEPN|nr:multidrug resistance protein D [Klebsiella pneumoniae]